MTVFLATERHSDMADKTPVRQGNDGSLCTRLDDVELGRMLLDLVTQTFLAAPPRTWVQSINHPGSRRWLAAGLRAISDLLGHQVSCPVRTGRRHEVVTALRAAREGYKVTGSWTEAALEDRKRFLLSLQLRSLRIPVTIIDIARSGQVPFSPKEIQRLQRQQQRLV